MGKLSKLVEDQRRQEAAWKVVSTGAGVLSGLATRKLLDVVWSGLSRGDGHPPANPADRRTAWPVALRWAIASSVGVGVAKLVSARLAAKGWELATGDPPPGIEA